MITVHKCACCGGPVVKAYNLSATRRSRPMYCQQSCESSGRRARNLKRRETHFWTKVRKGELTECWPWIGYVDPRGYGRYGRILAHRIAFQLFNGIHPSDKDVCHSCDNPRCCNPQHLWLGTAADNIADMIAKGRNRPVTRRGEDSNRAKLTAAKALAIYKSTEAAKILAQRYGVSTTAIHLIRSGKNWSHVTCV